MKVFVYRNLHKNCFSVKALEGPQKGRVIMRVHELCLSSAKFKVSEAGRNRVLKEKQKNVHAGIVGHLCDMNLQLTNEVTYNPYKSNTFYLKSTEDSIESANFVNFNYPKVFI